MQWKHLNVIFLFLLLSLYTSIIKAATPANCTYNVVNGWTQTINYQCSTPINMNGATIQFTVDNPSGLSNLNSVWGFTNLPRYPTNPVLTLQGNTVTLALKFEIDPVTLAANVPSYFSYSTNNNVRVTSFAVYPAGTVTSSGSLTFTTAAGSDPIPNDAIIHVHGVDTSFATDVSYANQKRLDNIPYGTYQLNVTGTVNGQPVIITPSPTQLTLDNSHTLVPVTISFMSTAASINFILGVSQPSDVTTANILVHVIDGMNVDHPVNVTWNSQTTLSGLVAGMQYTLSANPLNGQQNQYTFTFFPQTLIAKKDVNVISMGVLSSPLPTGMAQVTITGLPTNQTTSLFFQNNSGQTITFNNVSNGMNSYTLPAGVVYSLSTQPVFKDGSRYSTTPVNVNIQPGSISSVNLQFKATMVQGVNGWPNYIAMGAVTDTAPASTPSFQSRPLDAIFKYGGMGGNGDPGQIIYPIFDMQTAEQARAVTTYYQQQGIKNVVKPVMVIYTAQMSGGTSFTDFEYNNLVMHYITLIMESQKLESYKTIQNPYPASIVLNPDLFGMVQQQNLFNALNDTIRTISLQKALQTAVCFATHTINTQYGQNLNYEALFKAIRSQTTDNWSAMSTWDQFKMQYFNDCMATPTVPPGITIPNFTNDFAGWIQSNNWLIRQFGPDITFGWQENLWAIGSANWVHQNYSPATLKSQVSDPTATAIIKTTAYSGNYRPDFLAFDKYEMDSIPAATGMGYLYNARDWSNVLLFVKNISESLGSIPVMLWQIPGSHLQVNNDIDTRINRASTEPDYFFGNSVNPLPNLKSYITSTALPTSIYGTTSMNTYLSMNEAGALNTYTWQTNHLAQAAQSHVFAILWGGGNTTSVGVFPSDDNGWLANKLRNYYSNPTPIAVRKYHIRVK